jgi:hypothetical protein
MLATGVFIANDQRAYHCGNHQNDDFVLARRCQPASPVATSFFMNIYVASSSSKSFVRIRNKAP